MSKGHHILSVKMCLTIFIILLILTVVTVVAAEFDIGMLNFPLAMLIATVKASLVVFYFMGLKFDTNENRIIFFSSFIFVAIFVFFIYSDFLFRDKEKVNVPLHKVHKSKQWKKAQENQ